MDADPELLLVLAPGGQRKEAARLDDVLEDVLTGLQEKTHTQSSKPFKGRRTRAGWSILIPTKHVMNSGKVCEFVVK